MRYRWNAEHMHEMAVIPAVVADKHLKLASEIHLKVLLWLARFGQGDFNADTCAEALGVSKEDCEDAFCYWSEAGVLSISRRKNAPAAEKKPTVVTPAPETPAKAPAARPKAVKPQMTEVVARKQQSKAFSDLLDTASARLGRPISNGDMETLLYLFDTAGLPAEVILMVIVYAKSQDKNNMRYIEKVALDWADRGIDTIFKAEEFLCQMENRRKAFEHVSALLSLTVPPKKADAEYADQWVHTWNMSDDLITQAYRMCVEKTGKFNSKYMHAILQGWYTDGVKTPSQISTGKKKVTKRATPNSSLDVAEYEDAVKDYIPVYQQI